MTTLTLYRCSATFMLVQQLHNLCRLRLRHAARFAAGSDASEKRMITDFPVVPPHDATDFKANPVAQQQQSRLTLLTTARPHTRKGDR
jgi:hypothetical protein